MIKIIIFCIGVFLFATNCYSANLFIYTSPNGDRVVTDRPINLKGYVLENNNVSAQAAGQSLRYQDNSQNRSVINRHISNAAYLYDMDAELIRAVIRQESAFKIDAKSKKGAMGLMQLMPSTAKHYKVKDILDPKQNIYAGTQHLRYLLGRYQNVPLALAAYNAGETAVKKYNGIPPYPETENYVRSVLNWYNEFKSN